MKCVFMILLSVMSMLINAQNENPPILWQIGKTDSSLVLVDTLPKIEDLTIISVCRTNNDTTAVYWYLNTSDTTFYALSPDGVFTESIQAHTPARVDQSITHIELVQLSFPANKNVSSVIRSGLDSELYELAVFDRHLASNEALQFMTYLAIKYGITLDLSDYVSSDTVLWSANINIDYYNRVTGVGRDSTWGLDVVCSSQCANEPTLMLCSDSVHEMQYAVAGDDNGALELSHYDTLSNVISRRWLVRNFGINTLSIAVSPSSIGMDTAEFCMIVFDGSGYSLVLPSSVDSFATFKNIQIDSSLILSFCGNSIQRLKERERERTINSDNIAVSLYPNPTHGEFYVDVVLKEPSPITVCVFDERGLIITNQKLEGSDKYNYCGQLTIPQAYKVEVSQGNDKVVQNLVVY